jgi:hypothetical protein
MAPRKQPWFRFYVEAVTDVKLARLTPAQKWLWVVILAAAKQSFLEGFLMLSEREAMTSADIARMADMRERDVTEGFAAMERLGLIEMDHNRKAWQVVAWSRRQYESDNVSARTRKHRSNITPSNDDGTFHQRRKERSKNGNGTHQITDTDTETETDPVLLSDGDTPEVGSPLAPASPNAEVVPFSSGRPRDLLFEALMDACRIDRESLTDSSRGAYNRALKDIRTVGAEPCDVYERAGNYRMHFPHATLTPPALAKHWALCAQGPRPTIKGADVLERFAREGS